MGMAASQARYLGLSARKTNVEYEGQQINQARTALANQSANLFNQLLGLRVPSVPDITNYTTTQYSFTDGYNNFVVSSMQNIDDPKYNYIVEYSYYEDKIFGIQEQNTNPQVIKTAVEAYLNSLNQKTTDTSVKVAGEGGRDEYDVTIGGDNVRYIPCDASDEKALKRINEGLTPPPATPLTVGNAYKYKDATGNISYVLKADLDDELSFPKDVDYYSSTLTSEAGYNVGNSVATLADYGDIYDNAAMQQIAKDNPDSLFAQDYNAGNPIYKYEKAGVRYFATEQEMLKSLNSADPAVTPKGQKSLNQYYSMSQKVKVDNEQKALLDDASGSCRYSSIKFENSNAVFTLNTEQITNQEGYAQAMNQYNYDVMAYEKKIADINAKTKSIQEQDRTLELRLKQLDTEQDALSNEMEAVKKVIDKNVESTFKTFS